MKNKNLIIFLCAILIFTAVYFFHSFSSEEDVGFDLKKINSISASPYLKHSLLDLASFFYSQYAKEDVYLNPAVYIDSCQELWGANTVYYLTQPVSSTGTCFDFRSVNITLDCQGWQNRITHGLIGVNVYSAYNNGPTIRNCEILGPQNYMDTKGIAFQDILYGKIENVNVSNNRNGINIVRVHRSSIENSFVSNNIFNGIYLFDSTDNNLTNLHVTKNNNSGIYLVELRSNVLKDIYSGYNTHYGIFLYSSSIGTAGNKLINIVVQNNTLGGLRLDGQYTVYNYLENISSLNNGDAGISFYGSSSNILNNSATINNNKGIMISRGAYNTLLNIKIEKSYSGIDLYQTSENNLINLTLINNSMGIKLYGGAARNNIEQIEIKNTSFQGISLVGAGDNFFKNFLIDNSGDSGISMDSSSFGTDYNRFENGIINNSKYYGILTTGSYDNNFTNIIIGFTKKDAFINYGGNGGRHTLKNISFLSTNSSFFDLNINSGTIPAITLVDTEVNNYSLTGVSNFKKTNLGEINFLTSITAVGTNLSKDIQIAYNFVYANSSKIGLNNPASITLYGLPTNFINPRIMKDNLPCGDSCYNFTSLNAGTVLFRVTGWSSYSIGDVSQIYLIINSPQNKSYNDSSILVNLSATEENLDKIWFDYNGVNETYSTPIYKTFSQGNNKIIAYANNTYGYIVEQNVTFSVDGDTTPPQFTNLINFSIYNNQSVAYDIDASDASGISCFNVNNTLNFNVNCSGFLKNVTALNVGKYWLNISVNDTLNNKNSGIIFVNVSDSTITNTPPSVNAGTDQTISLPINTVALAGIVMDDGWPNPPGRVAVLWSKVSEEGTVTFGNASNASTTASFSTIGTYSLRLTANDGALSDYDELQVVLNSQPTQPPAAPTNLTVFNATNSSLTLSWVDNSDNEDGFKIERRNGSGAFTELTQRANANSISFTDVTVQANTTYFYRIRADNSMGNSSYSNEANGTTLSAVYCGDGICNNGESCSTCSQDCGSCNNNNGGGGGGGGGGSGGTVTLDESSFSQGQSVSLSTNKKAQFTLGGATHTISVSAINRVAQTVEIILSSEPQHATLHVGEQRSFDINGDSILDVLVRLNFITPTGIDLYIQKIGSSLSSSNQFGEGGSTQNDSFEGDSTPLVSRVFLGYLFLVFVGVAVIVLFLIILIIMLRRALVKRNDEDRRQIIRSKSI